MNQQEANFVWGGIAPTILIMFAVFFGLTLATDTSGRQGNDHVGPVPARVARLSPTAYLSFDRFRSPASLCGDYGEHNPVDRATYVPRLDAQYIQCVYPQHWDQHGARSPNFWHAAATVAQDTAYGALWVFLALAFAPLWLVGLGRYRRRVRRERRRRRADAEAQRQALATAYARGEIEQGEFERKLEEVLNVD